MKTYIKTSLILFFVAFCIKYLRADSLRMDYCRKTTQFDRNTYTFNTYELEPMEYTVNGAVQSMDSIVGFLSSANLMLLLPNEDKSAIFRIEINGMLLDKVE